MTVRSPRLAPLLALIAGMSLAVPVRAAQICSVAASSLPFGNYSPSLPAVPTDTTGSIDVECYESDSLAVLVPINYQIALTTGNSGSYAARSLDSATDSLAYNIYADAARLLIWGDGSGGSTTVNGTITLVLPLITGAITNTHIMYGRIPAAQNVDAGSYTDMITVTVTY